MTLTCRVNQILAGLTCASCPKKFPHTNTRKYTPIVYISRHYISITSYDISKHEDHLSHNSIAVQIFGMRSLLKLWGLISQDLSCHQDGSLSYEFVRTKYVSNIISHRDSEFFLILRCILGCYPKSYVCTIMKC